MRSQSDISSANDCMMLIAEAYSMNLAVPLQGHP